MTTRMRERFAPEAMCMCGARYAQHTLEGALFQAGRPPRLHCPGRNYWISIRKDTGQRRRNLYFRQAVSTRLPAGKGPWRILEDCPARAHNTQRAAEAKKDACVCPRGVALKDAHRGRLARPAPLKAEKMLRTPREVAAGAPSFLGGACLNPEMRSEVDGGFNTQATIRGINERMMAKRVCASCPLREAVCDPWVAGQEQPAGSWGGVWAGKDPWERMGKRFVVNLDETVTLVDA